MPPITWICVWRTPSTAVISRTAGILVELPTRSRRALR
jgi:hypothetical protein